MKEQTLSEKYYDLNNLVYDHNEKCKIFIRDNWEKISDWSNLILCIQSRHENESDYYSPNEKLNILEKTFSFNNFKIAKSVKFVYDEFDADLSVTINGKEYLFIENEEVLIFTKYIEDQLKNE